MFTVELPVIKPITAKQIKATTRKLISAGGSPAVSHGGDLLRHPDSAADGGEMNELLRTGVD